jgi:hypothetical protein
MKLGLAKTRSAKDSRDLLASTGLRIGRIVPTPSPLYLVEAFASFLRLSTAEPVPTNGLPD